MYLLDVLTMGILATVVLEFDMVVYSARSCNMDLALYYFHTNVESHDTVFVLSFL